jgi:ABC-type glycerol-3-phosphate transport system substrate-binding protein
VPATVGSVVKPCCSRLDLYKQYCGLDLAKVWPANESSRRGPCRRLDLGPLPQDRRATLQCRLAGWAAHGSVRDAVDWVGALFLSFGAILVDDQGVIKVDSDEIRAALEFAKKLMAFTAAGVYAWNDASNNRFLISGKGSSIINPPSAWMTAVSENPGVAEQCWTHDMPRGPRGRVVAEAPFFYGILNFASNKAAAKSLLALISAREQACQLVAAANGGDIPPFASFYRFDTWQKLGPPP